jgi:hypothetical protein
MARKIFECTNCKKTFSRKYNADSHNISIHNEMAVIYNKDADWISNKRKINVSSSPTISLDTDNHNTTTTKIPKSNNTNLNDFEYRDPYSKIAKTDEEKVYKIFEKISPLIDELDTLLISTYIQNINRTQILASVIISSLTSQNRLIYKKSD